MIIHYTLPHAPFIFDAIDWNPNTDSVYNLMENPDSVRGLNIETDSYSAVNKGQGSAKDVVKNYKKNVQLGLAFVDVLLENVDAENVIITADHGESLGENGVWGHPYGYLGPSVKRVPLISTSATDNKTYEPKYQKFVGSNDKKDREDVLKSLGYV